MQSVDGGADEDDAALGAGLGETDTLGEEPVAGMDRLCTGAAGRGDHRIDVEVGLDGGRGTDPHRQIRFAYVGRGRIRIAVHGDAADPEGAESADDSTGDLATVGDEHGMEGNSR